MDALLIGCDQILVLGGVWFDKPANMDMARQHLQHLRGRTHTLVTATVCYRNGQKVWSHLARPRLTVRAFTQAFLDAYLAAEGEALLGSVGAYRVEGVGGAVVRGDGGGVFRHPGAAVAAIAVGFLRQQNIVLN